MNKTRQIFSHAAIWISMNLFFILISGSGKLTYQSFVMFGYFGLINIAIFYINYLIILPKLLNRKKYLWVALSMVLLVLVSGLFKYGLATFFEEIILTRHTQTTKKEYHLSFWDYYI